MVEWKPLNKIVKSISTGLNPRQNFILNEEDASLYYVTVKEITTNKVIFSDSTDRITENAKQIINNRSKLSKGDILFSGIGTIGKVAYVDIPTSNWDCSESVFLIKPNELETKGKYLAYILSSDIAKNQYERGAAGAIMKGVRKATLESLLIPIPSLEEQTRIVGILDTFTSAIDNLKEQISQRRKQYEYYRDQLLDLEGKPEQDIHCWGEFCKMEKGNGVQKVDFVEKGIGCIHYGQIYTHYGSYAYETNKFVSEETFAKAKKASKGDVILTDTSENVEDICKSVAWLGDDDIAVSNHALIIKHNQNPKFLSYSTQTNSFFLQKRKVVVGVKVSGIKPDDLAKIKIFLPPLSEQQRIVSILDTFEASIANLEEQLKQREKQYEYYRNKLLTFE